MKLLWKSVDNIKTPDNVSYYLEEYIKKYSFETKLEQEFKEEFEDYKLWLKETLANTEDSTFVKYLMYDCFFSAGEIVEAVISEHPLLKFPSNVSSVIHNETKVEVHFFKIMAFDKQELIDYLKEVNETLKITAEDLLEAFI